MTALASTEKNSVKMKNKQDEVVFGATEFEAKQLVRAIGEFLSAERNRRGWVQKDISDRCGLTRRNVGYVEAGKGTTASVIMYAAALGFSYGYVATVAETRLEAELEVNKRFES